MKIKCSKLDFIKGLQTVSRGISGKNTIAALSGVLIDVSGGEMVLRSTDLEIAIEYREENVTIIEEGGLIVPGKMLLEIVKKLPNDELEFHSEGNNLIIDYGYSQVSINGFDKEEFPDFPVISGDLAGSFSFDVFGKIVKEVSVAASYDEARPIFTGLLFDIKGDFIRVVATDSHRLALKECSWNKKGTTEEGTVLIPNKILQEVIKLDCSDNPEIEMVAAKNQVSFAINNVLYVSRLIEGRYPNYESVIPSEDKIIGVTELSREELLSSIDRASVISKDNRDKVGRIKITVMDNVLTVDSQDAEIGSVHEEYAVNHQGEMVEVFCNNRYLLDILRVLNCSNITISFTGQVKPMIFRSTDDDSYLYLVLPLKP